MAESLACQQASSHIVCLSDFNGLTCLGDEFTATISTTRPNNGPFTFAIVSGMLPPGLSLQPVIVLGHVTYQATITGTTTTPGNYAFTIEATDAFGDANRKDYAIFVIGFTSPDTLPDAMQGTPYSFQLTADGGIPPYTFTLLDPLPDGLTMDSSGLISGTPTGNTPMTFTVEVSDMA
jgi:hypothetical protein